MPNNAVLAYRLPLLANTPSLYIVQLTITSGFEFVDFKKPTTANQHKVTILKNVHSILGFNYPIECYFLTPNATFEHSDLDDFPEIRIRKEGNSVLKNFRWGTCIAKLPGYVMYFPNAPLRYCLPVCSNASHCISPMQRYILLCLPCRDPNTSKDNTTVTSDLTSPKGPILIMPAYQEVRTTGTYSTLIP